MSIRLVFIFCSIGLSGHISNSSNLSQLVGITCSPVAYVTICTGRREITVQIDFFFDFGWSGSILLENQGVKTLCTTNLSLRSTKIF